MRTLIFLILKKKSEFKHYIILFNCILLLSFYNINAQEKTTSLKKITGKVTNLNAALTDVNIVIKNRNVGTKTNAIGDYAIQAEIGDQIQYSYVGFKTISIVVEDITSVLNIKMVLQVNQLEEAIVVADKSPGRVLELATKKEKIITTSRGTFNPAAFNVKYMDGKNIDFRYSSLTEALIGRFAGVVVEAGVVYGRGVRGLRKPVVWEVDGAVYDTEPVMDLSQIEDVYIPMSNTALVRWSGPVVIVRTKYGSSQNKETRKKEIAEKYTNKNYYQEDALSYTDSDFNNIDQDGLKEINGTVKNLGKALADVNIIINNKNRNLKTNVQGNYSIKANIGDLVQFRYMGFKTITIIVEDITSVLNIDMVTEINELAETVLAGNKNKGKAFKKAKKKGKKFSTSRGTIDPDKSGYAVGYFDGVNLNNAYSSLTLALVGRVSGYYVKNGKPYLRGTDTPFLSAPAIWDIDGIVVIKEPALDLSQIKDISFLKSLAATNRYGSAGLGGVIVVSTKNNTFDSENKKNNSTSAYTNKNYYNDDAVTMDLKKNYNNPYIDSLIAIKIKSKAFIYYQNSLKNTIKDYNVQIDLVKAFKNYYKDLDLVSQILNDIATTHNKNPEILKAIAFQMQAYGLKKEVTTIYEKIFKLRPHYAQSYRDLANAYKENGQFNKAWKLYMSYLLQGNDVKNEGIGNILYSEMEWLYFNGKSQALKNIQFVPKNKSIKDFKNDVRLVFEWNTSEAEFDLEFVNPNKQVYNFEHSLEKDQQLIFDEKKKGYSSKEFIIDNLNDGKWLVNLTYLGNKKPEPTYFKVTVYNHWGNPNQKEKISVYKLDKEHTKLKLYNIDNRSSIMVSK